MTATFQLEACPISKLIRPPLVLAIDPGTSESQFLLWDMAEQRVVENYFAENGTCLAEINASIDGIKAGHVCIEMVASYGMPVGREVFETCVWIGRFFERSSVLGVTPALIPRQDVKLHLCHSCRAKDGNVRQALVDRFGGKDAAIGRKTTPGPLYGISGHAWAALALAITFADRLGRTTA